MPAGQHIDPPVPHVSRHRTLPPEALAGLRAAFAAELAERLPRLLSVGPGSDAALQQQARRDAHNLASSAVVVGEREAGRIARQIENALETDDLTAVPPQTTALAGLLAGWAP